MALFSFMAGPTDEHIGFVPACIETACESGSYAGAASELHFCVDFKRSRTTDDAGIFGEVCEVDRNGA